MSCDPMINPQNLCVNRKKEEIYGTKGYINGCHNIIIVVK